MQQEWTPARGMCGYANSRSYCPRCGAQQPGRQSPWVSTQFPGKPVLAFLVVPRQVFVPIWAKPLRTVSPGETHQLGQLTYRLPIPYPKQSPSKSTSYVPSTNPIKYGVIHYEGANAILATRTGLYIRPNP